MSFSAAWLDLREPADRAARDPELRAAAEEYLGDGWATDLGCGTGATARAFGPAARWRLVDHDAALLAEARERVPGARIHALDLGAPGAFGGLPLAGARMVTASALLDLTPRAWIEALADRLAAEGIAAYVALTYDGGLDWRPPVAGDMAVCAAFNCHQRRDKGLGPALGFEAAPVFAAAMRTRGYAVRVARSPWRLGPGALRDELETGIAAAAAAEAGGPVADWLQARRAARGGGSVTVGHIDVLALPPGRSAQSKITSVSRP